MITISAVGFLAEKPVLKMIGGGHRVCDLTVLSSRSERRQGEWVKVWERAVFVAWDDEAERIASRLEKGSDVVCTGTQETQCWSPKGSTEKRYTTKYRLTAWQVLPRNREPQGGDESQGGAERRQRGEQLQQSPMRHAEPPARYAKPELQSHRPSADDGYAYGAFGHTTDHQSEEAFRGVPPTGHPPSTPHPNDGDDDGYLKM